MLKQKINYKENPNTKSTGTISDVFREIQTIKKAQVTQELRKELLDENSTRKRFTNKQVENGENTDQSVKYYTHIQEKIAEDMIAMTRNLKEQTEIANKIIKKDTEIVIKTSKLTDRNLDLLANESSKLQEHSKKAWKCWMWLIIAVVLGIFLTMVMFMRVTRKRTP